MDIQARLADRRTGKITRLYSRREIEQQILETFELVGGISRFARWANEEENYEAFLNMWVKIAPKEQAVEQAGQVLQYQSLVPQSPLNRQPVQIDDPT